MSALLAHKKYINKLNPTDEFYADVWTPDDIVNEIIESGCEHASLSDQDLLPIATSILKQMISDVRRSGDTIDFQGIREAIDSYFQTVAVISSTDYFEADVEVGFPRGNRNQKTETVILSRKETADVKETKEVFAYGCLYEEGETFIYRPDTDAKGYKIAKLGRYIDVLPPTKRITPNMTEAMVQTLVLSWLHLPHVEIDDMVWLQEGQEFKGICTIGEPAPLQVNVQLLAYDEDKPTTCSDAFELIRDLAISQGFTRISFRQDGTIVEHLTTYSW